MKENKVYFIGAGPGKPDLITVRGLNILREADVVIYDYLVDKGLLEYVKETAEIICCDKLAKKGRFSDGFLIHQKKISDLVVKKAKEGKKVVRLKNGDISIFSRLSQELEALARNKIDYELVPGVTAASGAASYSGLPLTDRRFASTCTFVTGHEDPKKEVSSIDWKSLSRVGTIVFYMAVENLPEIVKELIRVGRNKKTPCAIVQDASLITQKVVIGTLGDIVEKARAKSINPPAMVIVGEVVKLEKRFNWLRQNKRILFTGLSEERFFLKGSYFHLPLIRIEPMDDYRKLDNYIKNIRDYDWIVFASRYGVEYFFKRLGVVGLDLRVLNGIKIAAVGNSTARKLLGFGIKADLVPKNESSKGLLARFRKEDLKGKKIFMPRSDLSDKGLEKGLKRLGATVTSSYAYRNVMPVNLPVFDFPTKAGPRQRRESSFDEIMFTSPSTVRNFKKRYGKIPKGITPKFIGDVTLAEAKKCRLLD